jgi:hypothetical protein
LTSKCSQIHLRCSFNSFGWKCKSY